MKKETYAALMGFFDEHPRYSYALNATNKVLTNAIYVAYPCLLIWLAWNALATDTLLGHGGITFLVALLVPAASFALLTVLRRAVNAPRPYEVFGIAPAIKKDTKGKSFPSRHVFSIFVIGMTFCFCCPLTWAGPLVLVMGVLLAAVRVVSGVHFTKDVLAAAALGILCGAVELLLL